MCEQVLLLFAVMNGSLNEIPSSFVRSFQKGLLQYAHRNNPSLLDSIEDAGDFTEEQADEMRTCVENYQLICKK
jgi:F-type H+-transporting ATPase subunit alpha